MTIAEHCDALCQNQSIFDHVFQFFSKEIIFGAIIKYEMVAMLNILKSTLTFLIVKNLDLDREFCNWLLRWKHQDTFYTHFYSANILQNKKGFDISTCKWLDFYFTKTKNKCQQIWLTDWQLLLEATYIQILALLQ